LDTTKSAHTSQLCAMDNMISRWYFCINRGVW